MVDTTPETTAPHQEKPKRPGRKMTPQQRRVADSIRRIQERLTDKTGEDVSLKEKSAIILHAATEKEQENIHVDQLTLPEKMALLNGIGYSVGEQIFGELIHASRIARQKTQEAIPITVPVTLGSIASAHGFALRNPELAAIIAASDDAAIITAGLGYLTYKSIKGKFNGENFLPQVAGELTKQVDAFRENPARRGTQAVLFGAGCVGAMVALADPEGAGTTIVPILGGIASLEFTHRLTERLTGDIAEEAGKRQAAGQPVDITDPTFLISTSITSLKGITQNVIRRMKEVKTISKLLERLGTKSTEETVLPRGAMEKIVELLLDEDDSIPKRGSNTSRHQPQPPKGRRN